MDRALPLGATKVQVLPSLPPAKLCSPLSACRAGRGWQVGPLMPGPGSVPSFHSRLCHLVLIRMPCRELPSTGFGLGVGNSTLQGPGLVLVATAESLGTGSQVAPSNPCKAGAFPAPWKLQAAELGAFRPLRSRNWTGAPDPLSQLKSLLSI